MENQDKSKKVKRLRFEMDQVMIEELKLEIEHLKEALKNTVKKKKELYKVSLEYKKICEEEIRKNENLMNKIKSLKQELSQSANSLSMKDINIDQLTLDNNILRQQLRSNSNFKLVSGNFSSLLQKLQKNSTVLNIFKKKVGTPDLEYLKSVNVEKLLEKMIEFTDEIMQFINVPTHRKHLSCDEAITNPLFVITSPQSMFNSKRNSLSKISEDIEQTVNSSKNIIKSCVDTLESGFFSTRSNFSSSSATLRPKVKVFRREKSLSLFTN